jgi:hypothetical protein
MLTHHCCILTDLQQPLCPINQQPKQPPNLQQEVSCKEQEVPKHQSRLDKDEELTTTRQQLHDVHESWQRQVQELAEKQHQIDDLTTQLQDRQRNLQTVTETMVMQSTALVKEQTQNKVMESLLAQMETKCNCDIKKATRVKTQEDKNQDFDV